MKRWLWSGWVLLALVIGLFIGSLIVSAFSDTAGRIVGAVWGVFVVGFVVKLLTTGWRMVTSRS